MSPVPTSLCRQVAKHCGRSKLSYLDLLPVIAHTCGETGKRFKGRRRAHVAYLIGLASLAYVVYLTCLVYLVYWVPVAVLAYVNITCLVYLFNLFQYPLGSLQR